MSSDYGDLNDDKVILFDDSPHLTRRNRSTESPIRRYIRSIGMRLETRMNSPGQQQQKPNNRATRQRKNGFIGNLTKVEIEKAAKLSIEHRSHSTELDDANAPAREANVLPEDVKLLPRIPSVECCCFANRKEEEQIERVGEEEDLIADKSTTALSKVQPRVNNPKNVRIDLSLTTTTTVDGILNDSNNDDVGNSAFSAAVECNESKMSNNIEEAKTDNSSSAMRRSYRKIISSKLEKSKSSSFSSEQDTATAAALREQIENEGEPEQKQSIQAPSSTSRHQSKQSEIGSETKKLEHERSEIPILARHQHQAQMDKFKVLN